MLGLAFFALPSDALFHLAQHQVPSNSINKHGFLTCCGTNDGATLAMGSGGRPQLPTVSPATNGVVQDP